MTRMLFMIAALMAGTPLLAGPPPETKALIQTQMEQASQVTPAELKALLDSGEPVTLLDVRQDSEIGILGRIREDEVHIPRGYLEIKAYDALPDRDAKIVVYCGKGIRSAFAVNTLRQMGYTDVHNLKGGAKAWVEAGYPTIQ